MNSFEESMAQLAAMLSPGGEPNSSGFLIGQVLEAGRGKLRIACNGLQLEPEDLYLPPGLTYKWETDYGGDSNLRKGDRLVILSADAQDYYVICKAVRA